MEKYAQNSVSFVVFFAFYYILGFAILWHFAMKYKPCTTNKQAKYKKYKKYEKYNVQKQKKNKQNKINISKTPHMTKPISNHCILKNKTLQKDTQMEIEVTSHIQTNETIINV